ncbi:MAG: phasin family protein [Desulfuromonadia bacterium]
MIELIEKVMLTGLGTIALSQKKVEELVNDLKSQFRLSEDEGKALLERLTSITKESREKAREMVETEVNRVVDRLGLVKKSDYDLLLARLEALEKKITASDTGA